jgi:hypothetical protein
MIVPIFIDTSSIAEAFPIDKDAIDQICDNIAKTLAARYAQQLELEATHSLHQTKKRYIQAINVVDTGKLEGTVILDYSKDPLIRMIEEGAQPFDMKQKMLASPKAKTNKSGGKYITVPFRFGTPDAVGESDVFSNIMPEAVYEVVKDEQTVKPISGGSRSTGLTVDKLPVQFRKPNTRAEITDSKGKVLFKAYEHKSSIYKGLMKFNDATTGQNTYGSFRVVSENSDRDAWIHKGIEQYNLVNKAIGNFNQETEVQIAMNNEFQKLNLIN